MPSLHDFSAPLLDGTPQALADYRGHTVLVVNVASRCGLTPQYEGLETLWRRYRDQGLVVLGFPCNQFAGQEPGTAAEIQEFCSTTYDVTFPIFSKIEVNGPGTHPIYGFLRSTAPDAQGTAGADIEWNFEKFLVGPEGQVLARFAPGVKPEELVTPIEAALANGRTA